MRRLVIAFACMVALAALGCGGDEESADRETSTPIPTVPESATDAQTDTEARTESTPTEAPPAPAQPAPAPPQEPPGGGAPAPAPAPVPDSPDNDVPPPAGSPAERFEQFCEESPGACGQ